MANKFIEMLKKNWLGGLGFGVATWYFFAVNGFPLVLRGYVCPTLTCAWKASLQDPITFVIAVFGYMLGAFIQSRFNK